MADSVLEQIHIFRDLGVVKDNAEAAVVALGSGERAAPLGISDRPRGACCSSVMGSVAGPCVAAFSPVRRGGRPSHSAAIGRVG